MINEEYKATLLERGFIDEAGVVAEVTDSNGTYALCVNGEIVSLACGNPPEKVFSDSVDTLGGITVKRGLFGSKLCFTHRSDSYSFKVKGGKTLLEYFYMLANNFN